MPGGTGVLSFPFGPCTSSAVSPMETFTPEGTGMTLRPTRDIVPSSLPDVAEDLAAHSLARGRASGHDSARGGEDVDAEAAVNAGDLVLAAVDPAARAAHPLQVRDPPLHPRPVLEEDADLPLLAVLDGLEVRDVALVLEDAGDLALQLGSGHVDLGQPCPDPVPDPGGHVRDGIGHVHRELPLASAYQLALMTPGMSPESASLRKQIRHISNFLRYARGRPQERQRLYLRTPNFGLRLALAIRDSLATTLPSYWFRNGIPRYERTRGRATLKSRSQNSYIRSPRRVTVAAMGIPWRRRKAAMDFRDRRRAGFCPAILPSSSMAASRSLMFWVASPTPMLMTTFLKRGTAMTFG